uniref:TERF1-interacting nuclear factor 2 N-terminal domain-containing protein n=1 Tax=Cyclopterus lumpus TaxID=8103 RepID=A0A8C2XM47_CYCLU
MHSNHLAGPIRLMAASMWQVLRTQDVLNYWKVAEFVSLVMDMVPELLMYKHRAVLTQLTIFCSMCHLYALIAD